MTARHTAASLAAALLAASALVAAAQTPAAAQPVTPAIEPVVSPQSGGHVWLYRSPARKGVGRAAQRAQGNRAGA